MAPGRRGNPFGEDKNDLLADGLRSDQWDEQEEQRVASSSPLPLSDQGAPAAAAALGGSQDLQGGSQAGLRSAAEPGPGAAAPPPAGQPPSFAMPPPAAPGEPAPGVPVNYPPPGTYAAGAYPPPMAGAPPGAVTDAYASGGAWGQQQQSGYGGVGGDPYAASGPAGYPPGYPPQQGYAAPQGYAPAWTGGYQADQPLQYTTFGSEAQPAGPRPPMRCGGWGEQWVCFLVGIIIWPLWYVAVLWYCFSKAQAQDPRQRTPFILNCVASAIFTFIWVAIVVRETSGGWHYWDNY